MKIAKSILKIYARVLLVAAIVVAVIGTSTAVMADTTWTQTTEADFESGTLYQVDTTSSPGDVKLATVSSSKNFIFAFYGGSTTFTRYNISGNSWLSRASTSASVGAGGALAYDGGDYIYALYGNTSTSFYRYSISASTWTAMTGTPATIGAGGALAYDGGNYIYALRGNNQTSFYRYSISGNSWSTMNGTPNSVGAGGALAYNGSNYIYALRGNNQTSFYRYSISAGTWSTMNGTPNNVEAGGSLAYDGSTYLYALRGNNTSNLYRYSVSGGTWSTMNSTPANVRYGGALAYSSSGYLYALRGNSQTSFYRYSISGNSWSSMTSTSSSVTTGGALVMGGPAYQSSGTLTSSTCDTGYAANFGTLAWTANVTSSNTTVQFQIATNSDNATWTFRGPDGATGTYYTSSGTSIYAGHDGDRYIKYKAYLSTTDNAVTPALKDVSITYVPGVALPTATTGSATAVEETTATINGTVSSDGGEGCQYRFQWGTSSGVYTANTTWTGNVTTGQGFSAGLMGLGQGTKYYYIAELKNSAGTDNGTELDFLTKPEAPTALTATTANSTQINLSWTKGTGANRTKVLRKTGSYPSDYNDGTQVYFSTGSSVSDTGLSANTTYYYRAWSEVTVGASQQWSDAYASASADTSGLPVATTSAATAIEETTATINGTVSSDGGEACQYRFQWGTSPGVYTGSTTWTGSVTTGQSFSADLTSLGIGTEYYYIAELKNSAGIVSGSELDFVTKPEAPTVFTATTVDSTQVALSWTKGTGAYRTKVLRKTDSYPVDYNDGTVVYFDTGTSVTDSGLTPETTYYYRAWSEVPGSEEWSDAYAEVTATTSVAPTPTPTPTTPPAVVGGTVYLVDKWQVLAPWLILLAGLLLALSMAGRLILKKKRA